MLCFPRHARALLITVVPIMILAALYPFTLVEGQEPAFPKPLGLVNDFAGVIPEERKHQISALTGELHRKTGIPVVVVTMSEIQGADYNEYANRLYESWGIGKKGEDKGVLLFVTVKERKMRIEVGYGTEGVIPDGLAGEIRDRYMIPHLKKGHYGDGLLYGTAAVTGILAESEGVELTGKSPIPRGSQESRNGSGGFAFLPIAFLVVFLLMSSRRRGGRGAWLLLPLLLGAGGRRGRMGGGFSGGFGGFSGGFGGFGGGMSGGGGAGGGF